MKRTSLLLACTIALLLVACTGDSSLPEATGKASVRAVNAIITSPAFNFVIEERPLGQVSYKGTSATARWDDLSYTFSIDVFYAGDTAIRRVARQFIDFEAGKDYTLLVSGALANPDIILWIGDERAFDAAETVFEARFAHATASLGALDYYFANPGVVPVLGQQVATLSFGEVTAAADFAEDDYVLTITAAGDPTAVVYTSDTVAFGPQSAFLVTSFDGDAGDNAPIFVNAFSTIGSSISMTDPRFPPTVELVNASMDLGTSDVYDDELLTSLRVTDHAYLDVTAELDVAVGANTFFHTPAGDTSAVTLEAPMIAGTGLRHRLLATGAAGSLGSSAILPDQVPVETHAKLLSFQGSSNFDFLNLYVVEAGESIDEVLPARAALGAGAQSTTVALAAGSYDIYVTEVQEKVALAGPYRIDVTVGDIVDMIIVDTVDPAVLDVLFLSGGPTP